MTREFHVEQLRAQVKASIHRGDMQHAMFLCGIIVLTPDQLNLTGGGAIKRSELPWTNPK